MTFHNRWAAAVSTLSTSSTPCVAGRHEELVDSAVSSKASVLVRDLHLQNVADESPTLWR